jgi:hypothetical protein
MCEATFGSGVSKSEVMLEIKFTSVSLDVVRKIELLKGGDFKVLLAYLRIQAQTKFLCRVTGMTWAS